MSEKNEDRLRRVIEEEHRQMMENDKKFSNIRASLAVQEKEFEEHRTRLRHEHLARERALQREMEAREKLFAEREKKLLERQSELEHQWTRRQSELENLREKLTMEIAEKESKLSATLLELQHQKERYNEDTRARIEKTSSDYVSKALEILATNEGRFHFISRVWGLVGAGALILGVGFIIYITLISAITLPDAVTWPFVVFSALKGLVVVSLLAAIARYSFLFSKSYMREALKNADRRHAINFGKFYLESYGAAADWSQVQDAFKHWNTSGMNAFSSEADRELDFTSLQRAAEIITDSAKSIIKKTE